MFTEPLDDVLSFLITIGSPALAAYSLQITHLNAHWIATGFLDVKYPNSKHIPTVLSAFHHIPIRISHHPPSLHSLIVLPRNDDFWRHLLAGAKKTRRWTVPMIMNFILVIFAAVLTALDTVYSPNAGDIGYAIAAVWTFLLPLIIGWLHVGCEPEPNHLRNSLDAANLKAWDATAAQGPQPATSPLAIEFMEPDDVHLARTDELKTVPVFNYSRAFVSPLTAELVLGLTKNAAANAKKKIPVGNPTGGIPVWVEVEGDPIPDENRNGTDTEVIEYCMRALPKLESGSSPAIPLDVQSSEMFSTPNPLLPLHDPRLIGQNPSRWATGIWKRVLLATALALGLQWGTTGAAVVIHYVTPPAGLGCRALSYLLYGAAGTTSFFLFLASSILAHMSRPHQGQGYTPLWLLTCQETGAIICRRLGKCIAVLSAMGILLVCFLQVTDAFNDCFCASTTFDKGRDSVVFQTINYVVGSRIPRIWGGALVMAFSTALLFGSSIYLAKPPRR